MTKTATKTATTKVPAKQTTKKAAASNGDASARASAARDEMLGRINASTEKKPVIHSQLGNSSAKKIARQLYRDGAVQRVEREIDGRTELVYLPLKGKAQVKAATTAAEKRVRAKGKKAPAPKGKGTKKARR